MGLAYTNNVAATKLEPVDYVDTNIGTLSWKTWSTSPTVQLPHGMMEMDPFTTPGVGDKYLANKIYAFFTEGFSLMPVTGTPGTLPSDNASEFDHDMELATPYLYAALLEDSEIEVACTVTQHAAFVKCLYPRTDEANVLIYLVGDASATALESGALSGHQEFRGVRTFFYLEFDRTPENVSVSDLEAPGAQGSWRSVNPTVTATVAFGAAPAGGKEIRIRAAISYISAGQAQRNLRNEIPEWDFESIQEQARNTWNEILSRVKVSGGTTAQKRTFYTSIYRDLQRMKNITEDGRYYSGFDGQIHEAGNQDFYNIDQPWDTYIKQPSFCLEN